MSATLSIPVCSTRELSRQCAELAFAWGGPSGDAQFKQVPEDFLVEEVLGFTPDGEGEHLFLFIEKTRLTTDALQQILARHFCCPPKLVSFSGMKDRQAVTRQWFSIQLPGKTVLSGQLPADNEQFRVISSLRNSRKLKRGSHQANRFIVRLRDFSGDLPALQECVSRIAQKGVPNYFGPQRFGWQYANVAQAQDWFTGQLAVKGRLQRSMLLSAARAFLFNQLLSRRVQQDKWDSVISGDLMALSGTGACFAAERAGAVELAQRLLDMDIHPSGPLWGRGQLRVSGDACLLEQQLVEDYPQLCNGLEKHGLEQERRPLRCQVQDLCCDIKDNDLYMSFTLGKGSYATAVLRELIQTLSP